MLSQPHFVVSQVFAGIALIFGLASFQFKMRRRVLACLVVGTLFNAVHFILLLRFAAAGLVLTTGARYLTAVYTTRRSWMLFFLAVTLLTTFLLYQSPVSLLPCLATLVGTWGSFQPRDRAVRLAMMCGTSCWIAHNVAVGTPVATAMEVFILASNLLGYYRHCGRRRTIP
jgi:hypothetical protein